mgnify:CR=1 FL=1
MVKTLHERYDKNEDWFQLWVEDKMSIIDIMHQNMKDDLDNGYDPKGNSILKQMKDIEDYVHQYNEEMDKLKSMTPEQANHWCYVDGVKRGAWTA